MTTIQFVIQPLPGTEEQYNERLREVSEKINKFGFDSHRVFDQLKVPVTEMVIGPNHIGILLEDGRVFRIPFSINSDRLDLSKNDSNKNGSSKNSTPSSRQLARSRARLMRTTARSGGQSSGSRSTGVIIGGSSSNRPLVTVAAPFVPEELISQAEVVLQGKSRNLIIRELQRTNLDVNLAVNNLLSRDDEEVDDNEEGGDNYVPEDLISLLDNGFHGDNNSVIIDPADGLFSEEIFSNYSSIRNLLFDRIRSERNQSNSNNSESSQSRPSGSGAAGALTGTNNLSSQVPSGLADREAFSRWRDRQCYGPRRWINREEFVWDKDAETRKKEVTTTTAPIWISEDMQQWPDKNGAIRFKKIAALYSEFIAISENGELHQWKWSDPEPFKSEIENIYHPKTAYLNITEKVEHISANFIRASVVTESDKVATWMDDQLGYFGTKLEHAAMPINGFILDPIVSIHVCSLYTVVRTEANNIYWWGALPFEHRRLLWEKNRTKTKKPFKQASFDIALGTQVTMKKCPIYQCGSIGFTCANGVPKVGQLMNSVWDFNDVCRFKILNVSSMSVSMMNNDQKPSTSSSNSLSNLNNLEAKELTTNKTTVTTSTSSSSSSTQNSISNPSNKSTSAATSSSSANKETTDRIDMPPPPSPASSTCSDTGSVISHKRNKRMASVKDDSNDSSNNKKDEEFWQIKDVVIVEDKIGPIGKVLKVDGDYIAVRFPVSSSSAAASPPTTTAAAAAAAASNLSNNVNNAAGAASASASGEGKGEDDWQNCRLLRRDDVQIYKSAMSSKGSDWLQKLPKKININSGNDTFQLLALCVDTNGIHTIKKIANRIHYSIYNLYNSKQEQNFKLPTDSASFMGQSAANISMLCNNDLNAGGSILLRDGNRTLYPIAKDCLNSIKDPHWFDLPPVKTASMITLSLPVSPGNNLKSKVCITALLFEPQKLMPHILRCDVKNVFAVLNNMEREEAVVPKSILEERCDGSRNIFHACVVMCTPTSNKEFEDKDKKVAFAAYNLNSRPTSAPSSSNFPNASSSSSSAASSSCGQDGGESASGAGAGSSAAASSYCVAPTNMTASQGRTVSLREMMNRLINNDNMEQSTSSASSAAPNSSNAAVAAAIEDHVYGPNWTNDTAPTTNSSSSTNNDSAAAAGDDEICKISKFASVGEAEKVTSPNFVVDPIQRREQATAILQYMCSSAVLRPHLHQLLSAKDAQGQTPFMLAISSRAYDAAIIILSTILNVCEKDASIQKESMIFPAGSSPDMSPLYVICYNDTCSFTWTGADHINQNIFECKTCGLTGSLCCCTECARVCHKGHDCKLKRTSPTAYCDCWEKCKCKALISGNQQKRYSLLCKLVSTTDLVTKFNSKGESILLFLIQTVGRQTIEQRQYRANSRVRNVVNATASTTRKSSSMDADSDMPEHDLEPPKFARRALERLLVDWLAVRSMIMTGSEKFDHISSSQQPAATNSSSANSNSNSSSNPPPNSGDNYASANNENYNQYLQTQKGSTLLDKFTHNLFVKCGSEHLDTLLMTLVHEMQNDFIEGRIAEAEIVTRRFVRSVVRVFVIFNLEKQPNPEKRKSNFVQNKHIQNCTKVFQSFHKIAIEELCEAAEALIAPVRLGVLRPTAPFAMSSSNIDCSDDLFCVEPLAPSSSFFENAEPMHENVDATVPGFNMQSNYDNVLGMRETSESEDLINRESNSRGQDEDILEQGRNDETIHDDESDNDFTFNDAETESDSDDNQSNHDAQRSAPTRATVASETDDSEDSSPQDEEASEDGETDEHSDEFNSVTNHQLERRNVNAHSRSDLAPQSMQWAIRSRDAYRSTLRVPAGSSLVFIDPMALRRSNVPTSSAVTTPQEPHTTATTASNLARAFGILLRQISELLSNLSSDISNGIESPMKTDLSECVQLQIFVETRLKSTWDWLFSVMDTTEAQLKFGAYLTNHTDPTHPLHPLNLSSQSSTTAQSQSGTIGMNMITSARREFFTYCLSIMRAHTSEHLDALPVLDISALRHIAYVLDGIIYYMRNDNFFDDKNENTLTSASTHLNENEDTDEELSNMAMDDNFSDSSSCGSMSRRNLLFFSRSDSTLSLGCLPPDGFDLPIDEAIPLADKPHLLQPNSKREELFANLPLTIPAKKNCPKDASTTESFEHPPTRIGFSKYDQPTTNQQEQQQQQNNIKCDLFNGPSTSSSVSSMSSNTYMEDTTDCNEKPGSSSSAAAAADVNVSYHDEIQDDIKTYTAQPPPEPMVIDDDEKELAAVTEKDNKVPSTLANARPEVIIAPNNVQQQQYDIAERESSTSTMDDGKKNSTYRTVIVRIHGANNKSNENLTNKLKNSEKDGGGGGGGGTTKSTSIRYVRGFHFCNAIVSSNSPSWNILIGRWKLTLDLFGRVFMDDVGMENSSVLPELRGFPVKEMRFRRQMEKLRNGQQRDLILSKLERNRDTLIIQTFKELNAQFGSQHRRIHPPLTFNRVKVTFKDEPGEGSGVARSFYTSISEALLAGAKMPNLETVQVGSNSKYGVPFSSILRTRGTSGRDSQTLQKRGTGNKILWRTARERKLLNYDARPFISNVNNSSDNITENPNDHLSIHLQQLGERLFPKVYALNPTNAQKITGMILEIPTPQLLSILSSDDMLKQKVNEAVEIICCKQNGDAGSSSAIQSKKMIPVVLLEHCQVEDNEPLFYSPGKRGFYTPRQGYGTFERLNAFRNIGRLIGLCLQQNELLPLCLQRHVLKYILGRKIKFHDMAFFDPAIYESFRQLLQSSKMDSGGGDIINRMELYFVIDLVKEEGGGSVELIPGGRDIQVNSSNLFDYVKRYTEYRLIKSQKKALEALRDGVFDVLPESCLNSLTAEDLRLLLNGVGDINVSTLISYTTFNDESSEGSDKLVKFKRWFWSIVEKMNTLERQDLIYFWTGSPALPASEEGFQPLPSVTIRPADDTHLPTANTCISRLYIPLYSSKSILRCKMLLAIKSKNFGFV